MVHWLCSTPLSRFYTHPDRHCTRSLYAFKLEQTVLTHPPLPPLLPRSNIFRIFFWALTRHVDIDACTSTVRLIYRMEEQAGGGFSCTRLAIWCAMPLDSPCCVTSFPSSPLFLLSDTGSFACDGMVKGNYSSGCDVCVYEVRFFFSSVFRLLIIIAGGPCSFYTVSTSYPSYLICAWIGVHPSIIIHPPLLAPSFSTLKSSLSSTVP